MGLGSSPVFTRLVVITYTDSLHRYVGTEVVAPVAMKTDCLLGYNAVQLNQIQPMFRRRDRHNLQS
jgi:hypothetical protein